MSQVTEHFAARELPDRVRRAPPWPTWQPQADSRGKSLGGGDSGSSSSSSSSSSNSAKKGPGSGELVDCRLMELVQYDCDVKDIAKTAATGTEKRIVCKPIVRLFRR